MGKSKIEWTDKTWNPITGCTKVSLGCANCYAERLTKRFYPDRNFNEIITKPEKLTEPLRWKNPSKIFVCSMSDLFHENVPIGFIVDIFKIIQYAPWHTFIILTKRPERALKILNHFSADIFKNIWIGVTAENQEQAEKRIPILLQMPAAVRFVSVEPMLGPVDLMSIQFDKNTTMNVLEGCGINQKSPCQSIPNAHCNRLDWVICGCESGPSARAMSPYWARDLRDQCQAADVPFFLKQMNIDGKMVKMPELDGKVWDEYPGVTK